MAAALVVAVIAVAYGTQSPQLAVAEFAPSAQRAIEPPPTTLGDQANSRAGHGRSRPSTTTTLPATTTPDPGSSVPAAPTTQVGRARPCFGNPPRQTEDPMAPACAATIFEGDNGGDTTRGVSSTEIRVGMPAWTSTPGAHSQAADALFEWINQRFELYGRRLVPVYVGGTVGDALQARAVGAAVAEQNVFAALTGMAEWWIGQSALPLELTRQNIVTIVQGTATWWSDRVLYDNAHPYAWSVYPSAEDLQTNLGDLVCSALVGRPAAQAGDTPLKTKTRKVAVVTAGHQNLLSASILASALATCTGSSPLRVDWANPSGTATLRTGLERLRNDGATTLVCVCEAGLSQNAISTAHAAGFHPEWVLAPSYWATGNDEAWVQSMRTGGQLAPPIRLGSGPRLLPMQARPWFGAMQQALATSTDKYMSLGIAEFIYPELMLLASGIQAAGPNLTPDTFAAGLMSAQFPNPGAGQAPYYQPSAGFGPGDHSFYDDYNVGWWSDEAPALDAGISTNAKGSWCYLDQGTRFRAGTYPADAEARMFNSSVPCR